MEGLGHTLGPCVLVAFLLEWMRFATWLTSIDAGGADLLCHCVFEIDFGFFRQIMRQSFQVANVVV
jgi:hypothetical protein